MRISFGQACKTVLGTTIACLPGLFCWLVLDYSAGWALFIGGAGMFIGFALTMPAVSASRVLGGFVYVMVTKNISEEWGTSAYNAIAGEQENNQTPSTMAPTDPQKPVHPYVPEEHAPDRIPPTCPVAESESSNTFWWWASGLGGLFLLFMGFIAALQVDAKKFQTPPVSQPSEEEKKQAAESIQKMLEMDPIVYRTQIVPKPGEPDEVESQLRAQLAAVQNQADPDVQQIRRLQKSLEYWNDRKRKETVR